MTMADVRSYQLDMRTSSGIDLITKSFPLSSHPQSGRRLTRKHSTDDPDGALQRTSLSSRVHLRVDAQPWLDLIDPPSANTTSRDIDRRSPLGRRSLMLFGWFLKS